MTVYKGFGGSHEAQRPALREPSESLQQVPSNDLVKIRSMTDWGLVLLAKSKQIAATNPTHRLVMPTGALNMLPGEEPGSS